MTVTIDTVDRTGLPIRTVIERTKEDVVTIREGVIRPDYTNGVSWHHEIIFSGVKLEKLREVVYEKKEE